MTTPTHDLYEPIFTAERSETFATVTAVIAEAMVFQDLAGKPEELSRFHGRHVPMAAAARVLAFPARLSRARQALAALRVRTESRRAHAIMTLVDLAEGPGPTPGTLTARQVAADATQAERVLSESAELLARIAETECQLPDDVVAAADALTVAAAALGHDAMQLRDELAAGLHDLRPRCGRLLDRLAMYEDLARDAATQAGQPIAPTLNLPREALVAIADAPTPTLTPPPPATPGPVGRSWFPWARSAATSEPAA